jgi:hypothetical protein
MEIEPKLMKKDIIASGGQGIIYGCIWKEKKCAIKEIILNGNKEVAKYLFQELKIMVEKKSDFIVNTFGYSLYENCGEL